ncbi:MAG: hypothetical protein ACKVW3_00515 [Phycisphaerales bacterium]
MMRTARALMASVVAWTATAMAQVEPVLEAPEPLLARTLTRQTLLDLRATPAPTRSDFALTAALLRIAHDLDPKQQDILRRAIEAERSAGHERAVVELTRDLLAIDPADTIAQLRLLTATITENYQDAEARLAVYEKLIKDTRVDAAIRSRLALDAALLLRERGDTEGFVAKLKASMSLDSTNKDAAMLASAYVSERVTDPRARVEMLTLVLMADPVDPNVHLALARELAAGGAFKGARRFQRVAVEIMNRASSAGDTALLDEKVLQWYDEGPAAVVATITLELARQRDEVSRELNKLKAMGAPTERARKPEDVRLKVPMSVLVVMASQAASDPAAANAYANEMAGAVAAALAALRDPVRRGELTEEQAKETSVDLAVQVHTVRLWSGIQAEEAVKDIRGTDQITTYRAEIADLLDAFSRLRTGEPEQAVERLAPAAEAYPLAAAGYAMGLEAMGRREEAIEAYRRVVRLFPLDVSGAWSFAQLQRLEVKPDAPLAADLERLASAVPAYVDRMALEPQNFVSVTLEPVSRQVEALSAGPVRVTIHNLSQVPLGVGSDRPISSRMLFVPGLESRAVNLSEFAAPEVVDLNRRLLLMPREKLVAEVWPDAGQCGWMMESLANRSLRVRWRLVQGFQAGPRGGFVPGVMGAFAEATPIVRLAVPEASLSPESLARRITNSPETSVLRLAAVVRAFVIQPILAPVLFDVAAPGAAAAGAAAMAMGGAANAPAGEALVPMVDAFIARYPSMTPVQRAAVAALLPHARLAPVMARFDALVRADGDPLVRCLALVTRVSEATDDLIEKSAQMDDPRVREIAGLVKERLAGEGLFYSRLSLKAIAPEPPKEPEPAK